MRQVGERGRGSRRGSRRSPGLWLWCWGQRRPGRGKGGRGVTPSSVVTPRWEGRGMSQLSPSSGGTTLPRGGGQAGQGGAPRGLWAGSRSLFRRRCPKESGGEAGAGPGGGRGGAAAPGQGTQAFKDVGKTETGGSWGSGGGRPAAGASLRPGRVGWLRSRSFLRKKRRK